MVCGGVLTEGDGFHRRCSSLPSTWLVNPALQRGGDGDSGGDSDGE